MSTSEENTPWSARLLEDALGRVAGIVHRAIDGLDVEELAFRPDPDANSTGWLVWHLTRVQDDHMAAAFGGEQVWTADGWAERFGLPFEPGDIGFGHTSGQVAAVRSDRGLLGGYHDAVHERSVGYVRTLDEADLGRIVDESWDPPVTLAVRLVSLTSDNLQHAGQAAYARGIMKRVLRGETGFEGP